MYCIYEVPFWIIILFVVSLVLNVVLLCFHIPMRRMRDDANKLTRDALDQVNIFKKIANNSMEIVRIEQERIPDADLSRALTADLLLDGVRSDIKAMYAKGKIVL